MNRARKHLSSLRRRIDPSRLKGAEAQALKPFAIWLSARGYDVPALRRLSAAEMLDLKKAYLESTQGASDAD